MREPSRLTSAGPLGWIDSTTPLVLRTARGLYLLKNYPAVLSLLEGWRDIPGAGVVVALAHARMSDLDRALATFAEAADREATTAPLCCAHAACLLRIGKGALAAERLEAARDPSQPLRPVWSSLRGAAHWWAGREQFVRGDARDAVREFDRAAVCFVSASHELRAKSQELSHRLAATYVCQAVAMVAAEQFAAAIQLFARRRAEGMTTTPMLNQFARDLYEFCDLYPKLSGQERLTVAAALAPIVADAALTTHLWDGSQPVQLAWRGIGPLEGAVGDA